MIIRKEQLIFKLPEDDYWCTDDVIEFLDCLCIAFNLKITADSIDKSKILLEKND